jgi:hypothetical protein
MNHARAEALTRILRPYNRALSVMAFPDTKGEGRVWWVVYSLPSLGPVRLFTVDTLDPDRSGWREPGSWVVAALKSLNWQQLVHQAKRAFSMTKEEYRRKALLPT